MNLGYERQKSFESSADMDRAPHAIFSKFPIAQIGIVYYGVIYVELFADCLFLQICHE